MADTLARYSLLPWSRTGIASTLTGADTPTAPAVAQIQVEIAVDSAAVQVPIRVYGPGDVRAIDANQFIRTDPLDGAMDFESNCFAMVELRRPDLPWLFTPVANAGDHLRPWLCLVVLPASIATVTTDPAYPNPTLDLQAAGQELPDQGDLWASAHVQCAWVPDSSPTAKPIADQLAALLVGNDAQIISRLICFRRLDLMTAYVACVVPTFEIGRKAGLGMDPTADDEKRLTPAWSLATTSLKLPVYFHWKFSTGAGGDFESLARKLERVPPTLPTTVGQRSLDANNPGYGLPSAGVLSMVGAVYPEGAAAGPWPAAVAAPFQAKLRDLINLGAAASPPLVGPPIYGAWYGAQRTLPPAGSSPLWLTELNLDPIHRVAASLGAAVINKHQEHFMASAWDQLAHLKRANQMLRQAQLARSVARAALAGHLTGLTSGSVLQIARPLHSRVRVGQTTVAHQVDQSSVPNGVFSPTLRRLASPQSPLGTRLLADGKAMPPLVARLNQGLIAVAPPRSLPNGAVDVSQVTSRTSATFANIDLGQSTAAAIDAAKGWPRTAARALMAPALAAAAPLRNGGKDVGWGGDGVAKIPKPPGFTSLTDPEFVAMSANFRAAARRHQAYLELTQRLPDQPPAAPALAVDDRAVATAIDPNVTMLAAAKGRIEAPATVWNRPDPLDPMKEAPQFPQPMLEPLEEISQQWVLAGLEDVPHDAVYVMEADTTFLESYMVGLNHWMGRVLQWNEFPFFQRATFFRSFWPSDSTRGDIDEIANWVAGKHLGANSADWSPKPLILIIRSGLLLRYPDTAIYARHAQWGANAQRVPSAERTDPIFRGRLDPDITFLGFNLTLAEAIGDPPGTGLPGQVGGGVRGGPGGIGRGGPGPLPIGVGHGPIVIDNNPPPPPEAGWFFVIEQHPHQPRFGLRDADGAHSNPPTWEAASWSNLAADDPGVKALRYAPMTWPRGGSLTLSLTGSGPSFRWGQDSDAGALAAIALRDPVRVLFHASALLGHK